MFKRVFKTITVDNGSEFADAEGLQRSIINEGEKADKGILLPVQQLGAWHKMR